ncbi:MAG: DUF427 domain-containing protein [Pseudomonadota bacterium]
MRPVPIPPGPGQESVWDYPRPAIAEATSAHLRVEFAGRTIAETRSGVRTLETSHPPTYYFPRDDVDFDVLKRNARRSLCEWKGQASYFDLILGDRVSREAGWSYASPTPPFALIHDFIAFYPARVDACFVDGERVQAQPGQFYGGWITRQVVGPFKGEPGTQFW